MKKNLCLAVFLSSLCIVPFAQANVWTEVGDAGDTPLTAQLLSGPGYLTSIEATMNTDTDTDVFRIYIDNPNIFSVNMTGTNLSQNNDTVLYLMDDNSKLLFRHDDISPTQANFLSRIRPSDIASLNLTAGFYLVAYNNSDSNSIGTDPVTGWNVYVGESNDPDNYWGETGTVKLNFTGARFDVPPPPSVPTPAAWLLTMLGLASFKLSKQRVKG